MSRGLWRLLAVMMIAVASQGRAQSIDLSHLQIPKGFLDLKDVKIATRSDHTVTATAYTTLLNAGTFVLVSTTPPSAGSRSLILGLKPDDWSLAKSIPQLAVPPIDGLTLSNVGLVITNQDIRASSDILPEEDYDFYRQLYQKDDYELVLKPGINLIAAIPVERLDANSPLLKVMNALGIEKGPVLLQGTLGKSLTLIGAPGAGAADVIKDLYLRAELPPMRPPNSPEWFRSGQLALELTGDPSMRFVGEMTIRIEGEDLQFFLASAVAKTGLSIAGGLKADANGWQKPFGIQWLVLKDVVLQLSITATGSVEPGFMAKMVIGDKDIDVAVALAISPVGVPTNFMAAGESKAGVSLSDIAKMQQKMAAARAVVAEAAGQPTLAGGPLVSLDALPEIAFKDLALKFAPKAFPELGVERGMAIKGRMWLQLSPNGELTNFAGVDVSVGEDGFWARGDVGAFKVGPLSLDDTKLDLTATRDAQYFLLKGGVDLFGMRQAIDLNLSKEKFWFQSETRLFDFFTANIACESIFDIKKPSFKLDAVVQNDFGEVLGPIFQDGIVRFARAGENITRSARVAADQLDVALGNAQATVTELRRVLEANRARARANLAAAQAAVASAQSQLNALLAARNAAWSAFENTPFRYPALKAQRRAEYAAANVRYLTFAAVYSGARAVLAAQQAILDALPPVDRNIALMAADAALVALRSQLEVARDRLRVLEQRFAEIGDAVARGELLLEINRAEFHTELSAALGGGNIRWDIYGAFIGKPFEVHRDLDFSNVGRAAANILEGLLSG